MLELNEKDQIYLSSNSEEIISNSLEDFLKNNKIVVLDFSAKWCGPCRSLIPILEFISNNYKNVNIIKIDIDKNEDLAIEYNINSLPQVLFYLNNKKLHTETGLKEGGKNIIFGISNLIVRNEINSMENYDIEKYNESVKKLTQNILSNYNKSLNNENKESDCSDYDIEE